MTISTLAPVVTTGATNYDLADVIARADLYALVSKYAGPPTSTRGNLSTYSCPNPNHEDRKPSFTVQPGQDGKLRYRCWSRCGNGLNSKTNGDAIDLLRWLENLNEREAILWLGNWTGAQPSTDRGNWTHANRKPKKRVPAEPIAESYEQARRPEYEDGERMLSEWAERRGIRVDALHNCCAEIIYRGREPFVRFPFLHAPGRSPGYWQDRRVNDVEGKPRWLSPPGTAPYVIGLDRLSQRGPGKPLFIVEGVTDYAAAIDVLGFEVAILGIPGVKHIPDGLRVSVATVPRIYVIADRDEPGDGFRSELRDTLDGLEVHDLYTPPGIGDLSQYLQTVGPDAARQDLQDQAREVRA